MDLAQLAQVSGSDSVFRSARVISIAGRTLTVDMGGPVVVQSLDSCNPLPDQYVLIADGKYAVGAIAGEYRQATILLTTHSTNQVGGLVNGVYRGVSKLGSFTPTVGDVLPLFWSADGSGLWAGDKPGLAYVPPPVTGGSSGTGGGTSTGGGSTGGGGIVTTGTATYTATSSGFTDQYGNSYYGNIALSNGKTGFYNYGTNRMNELQSRSIQWGTISMPRLSGSGSVSLVAVKGGSSTSMSVIPGTSTGLTGTFLAKLIDGSGAVRVTMTGSGGIRGIPYGTIRIGWRSI